MHQQAVIFATDLRGPISAGVTVATRFATTCSATLIFLHVVPVHLREGEGMMHAALELASGRVGSRLSALRPTDPAVPHRHLLLAGDPLEELVAAVRREDAALLILEARRRTFFQRLWGPGLVERLQYSVPCPVVTYFPDTAALLPRPAAAAAPATAAPRPTDGPPVPIPGLEYQPSPTR